MGLRIEAGAQHGRRDGRVGPRRQGSSPAAHASGTTELKRRHIKQSFFLTLLAMNSRYESGMLKLLIETPNGLVTLASLDGERTTIGRAPRNDVVLDDLKASRFHAVIDVAKPFNIVRDLSSRNGLYLNGRRIRAKALASGDTLAIGGCLIRLIAEEDCDEIVIDGERPILGLNEDRNPLG